MDNLTKEKIQLKVLIDWFDLKRETIEERLRIQKIVWLFQNSISNIGYGFRWYIYGPYSKELSDACYDVMVKDKDLYAGVKYTLPQSVEAKFVDFRSKINNICEEDSNYNLLEAVASIDFLFREWPQNTDNDVDCKEMFERLKANKKTYHNNEPVNDFAFFEKAYNIWEKDFKTQVA